MKSFSELLYAFVRDKKVNIQAMAEYCGLDRTTIYKFIKGSRVPASEEIVDRIIQYLMLDGIESQRLKDAYTISNIGAYRFQSRKRIKEGLEKISSINLESIHPASFPAEPLDTQMVAIADETIPIHNGVEMKCWLHKVLSVCFSNNNKEVRLISLCNPRKILDLVLPYMDSRHIVKHVFSMRARTNREDISERSTDSDIDVFFGIISFGMLNNGYYPYYFYTNSKNNDSFGFHTFMISCETVTITFSEDLTHGIVYFGKEFSKYFYYEFEHRNMLSYKLFESIQESTNMIDLIHDYLLARENGQLEAVYQLDPWLIPFISDQLLEKYISVPDDQKGELIKSFVEYRELIKTEKSSTQALYVYSVQGFRDFLASGYIRKFPDYVYSPLDYEDRCSLMKSMIEFAKTTEGFRLINNTFSIENTGLTIVVHNDIVFIYFRRRDMSLCHFGVKETSIVEAFRDFFGSSCLQEITYSNRESVRILESLLEEYEDLDLKPI